MNGSGAFPSETIATLSKRAALQCSNPECGVLTAGPLADGLGAVNIGEAAHIYGRTESSARHDPGMGPAERADITNGLWLCRNCHKMIDNDEQRFPAELLFEWRRQHERNVLERIGRRGDIIREKLKTDRLRAFQNVSYLAQQIVLDHPQFWEYRLTLELLRTELGLVHTKWQQFKNHLYVRKSVYIPFDQITAWLRAKCDDAIAIINTLSRLITVEMAKAWGVPGEAGVDGEILDFCRLMVAAATSLLEWEEDLRFTRLPDEFQEVTVFLQGTAGSHLDELMKIPAQIAAVLEAEDKSGVHTIHFVFKIPDNFNRNFEILIARCYEDYHRRQQAEP